MKIFNQDRLPKDCPFCVQDNPLFVDPDCPGCSGRAQIRAAKWALHQAQIQAEAACDRAWELNGERRF